MWIYENRVLTEIPEGAVGFVYKISRLNITEDTSSPIFYIGKKNFYSKLKRKIKESDWKTYYGSSDWLNSHVERYGVDNFEREILRICYSKTEMTYHETMTQLNEDVLRVDSDSLMKKKYYNLNILGKFFKSKQFSKEELKQVREYINTGQEEYQRTAVTNGEETRYINTLVENIDEWLIENPEWELGSNFSRGTKDKIMMTDGEKDIFINEVDEENFLEDNPEWYRGSQIRGKMKCVNNGVTQKRIHVDEIDDFFQKNPDYVQGNMRTGENPYIHIFNNELKTNMYVRKNNIQEYLDDGWELQYGQPIGVYLWVTNGVKEQRIHNKYEKNYLQNGWTHGRIQPNIGKIAITNGKDTKYINKCEEIPKDWWYGSSTCKNRFEKKRKVVYNTKTGQVRRIPEEDLEAFLKENSDFVAGINYSNSEDTVFAVNMETHERCNVSVEEYKNNPLLTSVKTRKVKIKKKNRIIFTGYLKYYLLQNPEIPERFFTYALNSEDGRVLGRTKKYDWVEKENLIIKLM